MTDNIADSVIVDVANVQTANAHIASTHPASAHPAQVTPYIPASKSLPEITVRGLILGVFLAVLLAASTTFVGLKIARTIAGSIPAALISMLVLRRFRSSNILENNMVQTIASAGEVVAAGAIFTLPALIIMGFWTRFNYFEVFCVTLIGSILGVLFSVPLRRSMVVKDRMPYPEGLATAEVLIAGEDTKGATKALIVGSLFSAAISFMQTGFKIAGETLQYWIKIGSVGTGISLSLSPVMMAAGYIVGLAGLMAFIVGGVFTWGVGIPLYTYFNGMPAAPDLGSSLAAIQKSHFRYIGVGILAIGGVWGVVSLVKQIGQAISTSIAAMKKQKHGFAGIERTDRDIPFKYVLWGFGLISIPIFILFYNLIEIAGLNLSSSVFFSTVLVATLFTLIVSFICAAIGAYITGIVGTTSLPLSGITIVAIIGFSSLLLLLLKGSVDFSVDATAAMKIASTVIMFAAVICVATAVSGDNMQDLKAGLVVGSTPWKQQMMLIVGSLASALVIPLILQTTFQAYGIGDIFPRTGMNPAHALPAPQATLMATVAQGFFQGKLPWDMVGLGVAVGAVVIIIDEYLKRTSKYRFPALLFALGVYFPFSYVTAFAVGGIVNTLVKRALHTRGELPETNNGILFASGIIAGEAILGALLTIPFAYKESTDIFALHSPSLTPYAGLIGGMLFFALCVLLYRSALQKSKLKPNFH